VTESPREHDAVRSGAIPRDRVNDLGIIISVWLDPSVVDAPDLDHELLFRTNREATAKAIGKAMRHEPSIDWLLEHQHQVQHYFHQLGVDKQL
jgi:formaldehyde-activating enzyme